MMQENDASKGGLMINKSLFSFSFFDRELIQQKIRREMLQLNYVNLTFMISLHLLFVFSLFFVPWEEEWNALLAGERMPLLLWSLGLYWFTGLGITMGYHRLWSHRTFKAKALVECILLVASSMALQNSAFKWCSDHRTHHSFTDSDKDPYDATCGFLWSHLLWVFYDKPQVHLSSSSLKTLFPNIGDLIQNPLLRWQHRYYFLIGPVLTFAIPLFLGFLYGDILSFFIWAGLARLLFVFHSTFLINSLAHTWGKRPHSQKDSAKDSLLCAFLALGEGYHNYHHTYPQDYRNGIRLYHFDPTKWMIRGLSWIGLTWDLKKVQRRQSF
jgi:stearoyl-CoA desaturase (delta-9 desaturase)